MKRILGCGLVALVMLSPTTAHHVKAADLDLPAIPVRVGDHPGFGRVVFELPHGATYKLAIEGDRLLLVFDDIGSVEQPKTLPHNVLSLRSGLGTATLVLASGAKAHPTRAGDKLVLDLLDPVEKRVATSAEPEPGPARPAVRAPTQVGPKPFMLSPATGDMREKQSEGPASPGIKREEAPPAKSATVIGHETPAAEAEGGSGGAPIAVAVPVVPVRAEDVAVSSAAGKDGRAQMAPAPTDLIMLPADLSVGAASFRRGEFGLLVLDRKLPLDVPPGINGATVVLGQVTSMLQIPLAPGRGLRTKRLPAGWSVEIVDQESGALAPQTDAEGVTFPFARPGRAVTVLDPVTGGLLLVGTSLASGPEAAVASGLGMPDYRLLPTWLGVAVEPVADQVDLRGVSKGFVLTGSTSPPARTMADIKGKRFDLPNEPAPALLNRLKAQLTSAAAAPARGRTRDRMAAAQAYIALGMGVEAQALMQIVAADDPQAMQDAQVLALGAVAAVMAGRLDEAAALDDPRLDGSDEIALWRGLRDRRGGRDTAAARALSRLVPMATAYPDTLRRAVWPDVAEAGVEAGTIGPAEQLPPFAKALLLERNGKIDEALSAYDALAAGSDRLDQVRGTLNAAELRLASGRTSPGETADIFERQAFAWRGDSREAAIRMRAAELRAAAGQWRLALDSLRQTETVFPDQQSAIRVRKGAVFQSMLTAQGGTLTPLEVVLMAADFADCVPEGPQGAGLAALLAEKLASLDLPARAIPVLQGLVKGAPPGSARAEFGLRLGQLLLEGDDASGASVALQASASSDMPGPLLESRALLLAKVKAAQGDVPAAVRGLIGLGTAGADDLRATLLAGVGDWRGSLAALSDLAAKVVPADGSLPVEAQTVLMRQASAAAQADDAAMLRSLGREAPRMTGARADLFRVLTAAPLAHASELPRAAQELKLARVIPQRIQDLGSR